jgi:endoglucanase
MPSPRSASASALGRGVNLAGVFDRRDDQLGWRVDSRHLDAIAAAGFRTVRLPVRWWGHAQVKHPYRLDEIVIAAVSAVIAAAWARGLAVVLTMHHADAVFDDPEASTDRLLAIWRQITERFGGCADTLAFELLNEPRLPLSAREWNRLLPRVLEAVRDVDPARLVVVGSAEASTVAGLRNLGLPLDDYLVVTVHYYEPFHFTHQGASWISGSASWLGTQWGSVGDRRAVTADLEEAAAWAHARDVPLYVGEFGTLNTADHASRVRWTRWVREELERLSLPWAYWDFGTDFGAYDLDRDTWRRHLLDALTN